MNNKNIDRGRTPPPSRATSPRKNDRENEIFFAVRKVLEDNGEMGSLKAMVQTKVLQILRGGDNSAIIPKSNESTTDESEPRINILNKLILEYFHWFGYQYSVEMFASESGIDPNCPSRIELESKLGEHSRDIPILLELIMRLCDEKND